MAVIMLLKKIFNISGDKFDNENTFSAISNQCFRKRLSFLVKLFKTGVKKL